MTLRIVLVSDWFPPRRGGIESQLAELADRLAMAGHRVTVVTTTPGTDSNAAFEVIRLDVARLPPFDVAISPALLPRLRAAVSGADVVHAHLSVVSPVGWLGIAAARSGGIAVAATFHSVLRRKAWLLRAALPFGLGRARVAWSAVSALVAAQVRGSLGRAVDVQVLPNGVDVDDWKCGSSTGARGEVVLVASMRLQRKKRPAALVRIFADAVRGLSEPVRLVIAGDGPARERIERLVSSLRLDRGLHRVELRGWLDRDDLRSLYGMSDGFLMASTMESFGIAALEAAAAGLPVIARRAGSLDFLRDGENAILADSDAAMTAAVRRFVTDANARPAALRSDSLARYAWPAVIGAHLDEYDRAMELAGAATRADARTAGNIPEAPTR